MTDELRLISGAGGGGKGARTPKEAADTLNSTQQVTVVDLLSEGEIQGLKDGGHSIFLDNTPLLNRAKTAVYAQSGTTVTVTAIGHGLSKDNEIEVVATSGTAASGKYKIVSVPTANSFTYTAGASLTTNGSLTYSLYNFKNVEYYTRTGTQTQDVIPIAVGIEDEKGVGVPVSDSLPVVRTITDANVDAVRVTLTFAQFQEFTSNGDIVGSKVNLQIAIQYNGGGFTVKVDDTITGRSNDAYQKDYLINLDGAFPVDVKVIRVTPDSISAKVINEFIWSNYTEIVYDKLNYPNSALLAMRVDAEQFSRVPTRSYLIRGIRIKLPSNATVDQTNGRVTYTGAWNGTFGAAQWCSDPAWIMWDLLTSSRYGFGEYLNIANLDRWSFYAASQYCNELVPDGFGGHEPRFSCNVNIQSPTEAYKLINDMCSVFRAMPYWSVGSLTISQDRPGDAAYLFTLANVAEGGFSYTASSQQTRPSVVLIGYLDLDTRDVAYEQVEDLDAIKRLGVVTQQVTAFACTSRGQARRLGEFLLYSNNYETEVVSFTASIESGVIVRPGQIINIADPMRAGGRRGGRIRSATTTAITVDNSTGLPSIGGTLSVVLPNGTVETKAVSGRTGDVITVTSAFSVAPNANSVWIYETDDLKTTTWRVISVQEQDGCMYQVSALSYDAGKYNYIERNQPIQPRDVTNLNLPPLAPTGIDFVEALYKYQAEVRSKIVVSWIAAENAVSYFVRWRKDNGNWQTDESYALDYELLNTIPGLYDFEIYSVSASGKQSAAPLSGTIDALGKTAPPSDVASMTATLDPDVGVSLSWTPVTDLDIQGYEIWQGPAFGSGTKLGVFAATAKAVGLVSAGTTTWYIKALDTSGSYSVNATSASITVVAAGATSISGVFANDSLIMNWTPVAGSLATAYYEIRHGTTTTTWANATVHGTVQGTAYTVKGGWSGTRRFFIAAVDIKGNVGTAATYDAVITAPSQPTITQQVIDNNVLLQWTDATATLPIVSYELRRGSTWAGGTVIGTKQGKFTVVFESTSGTYTYWLAGIDSAGNYGTPGSVAAQVNQPPDYVLKLNQNSTFSGTKTNAMAHGTGLLACIDTAETWQDHFTTRSWTTPQDQIDAGYAYYAMPSKTTGQYYEDIDYGTVLAGTKVSVTLDSQNVVGSTTIAPTIKVKKLSGDAWTSYADVTSVYATDFRYVRVQYDFTSSGGNDLLLATSLNIKLDSKIRNDSGNGYANSGDTGGTTVNFNIAFVDVDSITVTPLTTSAVIAVYDFTDVPNPTSFKVLLFNTSGTRVSGNFSWSARGV